MRHQHAIEVGGGLFAAVGVLYLFPQPAIDYRLAFAFFMAMFLLDLLDLRMPYGDLMPVDSSLVVACILLGVTSETAGPTTAVVSATAARLAVHLARNGLGRLGELADILSRRWVAILASSAVLAVLEDTGLSAVILSIVVSSVFVALDLVMAQVQSIIRLREAFLQLLAGNLVLQWPLLASQVSAAALLVVVYPEMGPWGLVLMLALVLLMRQSLALLLDIRQAYRSTIEALVASIEIQDKKRRGHAERVERFARTLGLRVGLRGKRLEALAYAALLHDADLIGVDSEDLAGTHEMKRHSADIVAEVQFLRDVTPILRMCDGTARSDESVSEDQILSACIVAVASDADDTHSGKGPDHQPEAIGRVAPYVEASALDEVLRTARQLGIWPRGADA